jgi:hypothetical protein
MVSDDISSSQNRDIGKTIDQTLRERLTNRHPGHLSQIHRVLKRQRSKKDKSALRDKRCNVQSFTRKLNRGVSRFFRLDAGVRSSHMSEINGVRGNRSSEIEEGE